jgi:hypothetical protein
MMMTVSRFSASRNPTNQDISSQKKKKVKKNWSIIRDRPSDSSLPDVRRIYLMDK